VAESSSGRRIGQCGPHLRALTVRRETRCHRDTAAEIGAPRQSREHGLTTSFVRHDDVTASSALLRGDCRGAPISGCCIAMAPEFLVDREGTEVWATWPDSSTLEGFGHLPPGSHPRLRTSASRHYLPARERGGRRRSRHCPARARERRKVPQPQAAFFSDGHPVLADDIVASWSGMKSCQVQPAYPQLRLWPESVALLYGAVDALPRLTPTWDKRALDLTQNGCHFQTAATTTRCHLCACRAFPPDPEPRIEGLQGRDSLADALANSYVGYLLDGAMRGQEFESLGRAGFQRSGAAGRSVRRPRACFYGSVPASSTIVRR